MKYVLLEDFFVCSADCVRDWILSHQEREYVNPAEYGAERVHDTYRRGNDFRSMYEMSVAAWLTKIGLVWEYEAWLFKIDKGKKIHGMYTPDFYIPEFGCFLEVKGIWWTSQRKKFLAFRKQYKPVPILLVNWIIREQFGFKIDGVV